MRYRIVCTLALCVVLLGVGLAAPAAGASPLVEARVATLRGLVSQGTGADDGRPLGGLAGPLRSSRPTAAPFGFSLVGLGMPPGAEAEIRTSADGRQWSDWIHVEVSPDERPDGTEPGGALLPSAPIWVGEARHVQTRVAGAEPDAVAVHLVDSVGFSRDLGERLTDAVRSAWRGTPAPALAAVDQPLIRTRGEWGADESRTRPADVARRVRSGFLHHTVTSNGYGPGDVPAILRGIQAYHVDVRGWNDIGYNLLVDQYGTVWEGRAGGVDRGVIGAQAGGFNTGSFGVALIGDFSGRTLPAAGVDGLARALAWKYDVHHIDVTSQVDLVSGGSTRYPAGAPVRLNTLAGHRDVSQTSCPGGVYDLLPTLRARVAAEQGPVLLDHTAAPGAVRVVNGASLDGPLTFSTRLRPAGSWSLEVRDAGGTVVHADAGTGEIATSTWTPAGTPRGTYTYTFAAEGRRPASETVDLQAPELADVAVEPSRVLAAEGGGLSEPVRLRARLWPTASWAVSVTDAAGAEVFRSTGTGETVDVAWDGAGAAPGTYAWRIGADDVEPATGQVSVAREVLRSLAATDDAVAGALEVSRAAFPETASAPAAVLARADVFADAMAGGPLAGARGPVLLTGSQALDARVGSELGRIMEPGGTVYVLGGEQAVGAGVVEDLEETWRVVRLGGAERTETAARVAEAVVERTGARVALVARASAPGAAPWADALAGGAYGADRGYPVLLTDTATLSPPAAAAIARLGITETVVLGGTAAVSDEVARALPQPRRVAGEERAATAAAVARELWGAGDGSAGPLVLAGGYAEDAWAFALAATPLAALHDAPLYLGGDTLPEATRAALDARGAGVEGWVLGSERQVSGAARVEANLLLE